MDRRIAASSRPTAKSAFTLIELLIVVAIIAILAAIAVPNFLEAQMRAKISRVQSDLRTVATALESYKVDTNKYPPTPFVQADVLRVVPTRLSTPIAYVTSAGFQDPFLSTLIPDGFGPGTDPQNPDVYQRYRFDAVVGDPEGADPKAGKRYYYQSNDDGRRVSYTPAQQALTQSIEGSWVLASVGPDKTRNLVSIPGLVTTVLEPYDATNGTISGGDIVRSQRESNGSLKP